jgi:hypothetical protein
MGIRPEEITKAMIERDPSGRLQDLRDQALGSRPVTYTSVLERE